MRHRFRALRSTGLTATCYRARNPGRSLQLSLARSTDGSPRCPCYPGPPCDAGILQAGCHRRCQKDTTGCSMHSSEMDRTSYREEFWRNNIAAAARIYS